MYDEDSVFCYKMKTYSPCRRSVRLYCAIHLDWLSECLHRVAPSVVPMLVPFLNILDSKAVGFCHEPSSDLVASVIR